MNDAKTRRDLIAAEMLHFPDVAYIGFSGGKDSSAVVKLLTSALRQLDGKGPRIEVVYCDTGVENPIIDRFVKSTLSNMDREFLALNLEATTRIIQPITAQSFFVRVIGRGYPPPTNSFRWCTKDVRIRPFQHFLRNQTSSTLIAVGTRMGESVQRDRSLKKSRISRNDFGFYQRQREGFPGATLFAPIIDFSVEDVWTALVELEYPKAIDTSRLAQLYKDGGGECPAIRDFTDKPCSRARFGCWTCTVVRRDKSSENLLAQGYEELRPFFNFREWLLQIRNIPENRCRRRRNGQLAPGPFTLQARQMILERVLDLQKATGKVLITLDQRKEISRLWRIDRSSAEYSQIE